MVLQFTCVLQCRRRYNNVLSAEMKTTDWSAEVRSSSNTTHTLATVSCAQNTVSTLDDTSSCLTLHTLVSIDSLATSLEGPPELQSGTAFSVLGTNVPTCPMPQEDRILIEGRREHGNKWSMLAGLIGGRCGRTS